MQTHYEVLQVSPSADLVAIKKAYHKVSLAHHPDKTVNLSSFERTHGEDISKRANVAYETLADPAKRQRYDVLLKAKPDNESARQPNEYTSQPTRTSMYSMPAGVRLYHPFWTSSMESGRDFHWYHNEVVETKEQTTITFSNWLGWTFSVAIAKRFRLISKPKIPAAHSQKSTYTYMQLSLLRATNIFAQSSRVPDVEVDLRRTPDAQHTAFTSTLVDTGELWDLRIDIVAACREMQKACQGPTSWTWEYDTDHGELPPSCKLRVSRLIFYPLHPSFAVCPTGNMPSPPYPGGSPMFGLTDHFPGLQIEQSPPDTYCREEQQADKTFWRVAAFGSRY